MTRERLALSEMMRRFKQAENEPLRALIDEYLLNRDASPVRYGGHEISMNPRPRPHGRFSPSSVYGCQRAAVMKFVGLEGRRKLDPDKELLFEDGNWRHHKWQYLFYDMELVLGRDRFRVLDIEQFISMPELYVAGSLDALIAIRMPNGKWRKYVVDFKGINDRGFQWLNSSGEPKPDNIRQLLLYMRAKNVRRGILLYDNKNNNLPKTFTVDFSGEHWEEVLQWLEQVQNQMERKRLPSRHIDCRPGSMMHESCPFSRLCWGHTKDSVEIEELTYAAYKGLDEHWREGMEVYSG